MNNLYAALVAAQSEVQPVGKTSVNQHHRYKYASGDDVVAEARRALNTHGLAVFALASEITEHPFQWEDEKGVHDDIQLRLNVQFRLVHTSGEAQDFAPFSVPVLPEKGRPLDKAEAGARTYALSYFLRELLLIPRVDAALQGEVDPDTRDDRNYEPRRQVKAQGRQQRPPQHAQSAPQHVQPASKHVQAAPSQAHPAEPPRRSTAEMIRAGVVKAEELATAAGGEAASWLAAELDRLGMVVLEPEQADEGAREAALKELKVIVTKLKDSSKAVPQPAEVAHG